MENVNRHILKFEEWVLYKKMKDIACHAQKFEE